jgi:hypothetical protein
MASKRQIEANRRNALNSSGPKTVAGRKASSQNSRRHGLYADPPIELVHAFYCLIVGNPEARISLQSSSILEWASLQLAEADARLYMARKFDADQATRCEEAIRHRSNGASVKAKPIHKAAKKMRQLSDQKLERAICGDISVVPAESLIIYGPYWKTMKRLGWFDECRARLTPELGLLFYSEEVISAVDNAGRGELPRGPLRLRAQLEGKRSKALAAWLRISAAERQSFSGGGAPRNSGT